MKILSRKICMTIVFALSAYISYGQWVVTDPTQVAQRAWQYAENSIKMVKEIGLSSDQLDKLKDVYNQGKEFYDKTSKVKAGFEKSYEIYEAGSLIYGISNKVKKNISEVYRLDKKISNSEKLAIFKNFNNMIETANKKAEMLKRIAGKDAYDMSNGERMMLLGNLIKELKLIDASVDSYSARVTMLSIDRNKDRTEQKTMSIFNPYSSFHSKVK